MQRNVTSDSGLADRTKHTTGAIEAGSAWHDDERYSCSVTSDNGTQTVQHTAGATSGGSVFQTVIAWHRNVCGAAAESPAAAAYTSSQPTVMPDAVVHRRLQAGSLCGGTACCALAASLPHLYYMVLKQRRLLLLRMLHGGCTHNPELG